MEYRFVKCKPQPILPDKLMTLTGIKIIGCCVLDGIDFAILDYNGRIIAFDINSGFYYPFASRWLLMNSLITTMGKGAYSVDGTDVGEIIKSCFILGREEGQKRLREVLEVPTAIKILILSGGGLRIKDRGTGERKSAFILLEGARFHVLDEETIASFEDGYSPIDGVLNTDDDAILRVLAHKFLQEESRTEQLLSIIQTCSDSDEEGSVGSVRERINSKTLEQEKLHTRRREGPIR